MYAYMASKEEGKNRMRTEEEIKAEIKAYQTLLSDTSGYRSVIALLSKLSALNWVLETSEEADYDACIKAEEE